ncbi:hypothetical protein NKG94_32810 [Micromonospora sp. M12]
MSAGLVRSAGRWRPEEPHAVHPDLDRLLTPGARFTDEHGGYQIEVHPVGDIVLPTGQVVGATRWSARRRSRSR